MKLIFIIFILILLSQLSHSQDYRVVDWKTIPANIQLLGVDTFKFSADPIDFNDVGVGQKDSGYYFIDYIARAFLVIGYDATTITVVDLAHENTGPNEGQIGRVYESIVAGDSLYHSIGGVDVSVIDELSRWKSVARDNELFGRAILNSKFVQPLDSLYLNPDTPVMPVVDYAFYADTTNNTISFKTGLGSSAQLARESLIKVYNNNGVIIENGEIITGTGIRTDGTIEVERAIATNRYTALLWATTDIPIGGYGDAVVLYGSVRDVPTTGISLGQVWLSDIDSGKVVNIAPEFPSYVYSLGAATIIDGTAGQYEARLDAIDFNNTTRNIHNGQFRETISALVSSNGTAITLSLEQSGGGDLTQMWSSGFADLDCTPAKTVTLTAGTDIAPQANYVYILESDPTVLVVSTIGFPKGVECIRIYDGALFSATRTQTDDGLANRNWNDHLQGSDGQGHLLHISERLRQLNAQHNSGMAATMTVTGGSALDISMTAGDAYQLHLQDVDAMNTATGSYIYVQNRFGTPWDRITDIENLVLDANGNTLNNTSYSIAFYAIANKTGETDHYIITVPTGTYSKNTPIDAEKDLNNYTVYDFPDFLKGKAVLVAKFNIVNNGGVLSLYSTQDLRGKVPNAAVGGGGGGTGVTDFLSLFDTYSSYTGLAGTGLKVSQAEAGLEVTQWTEDVSGNVDVVGTVDHADGVLDTEGATVGQLNETVIDTIYTIPFGEYNLDSLVYEKNGIKYLASILSGKDGLVDGGLVTWQSGLIFNVSPAAYYFNDTLYTTSSSTVTLTTADATNPRFDVIIVNKSSQVTYITGTPSATPVKPTVDPTTQIELTSVYIPAGATVPEPISGTLTDSIVYNENTEWSTGSYGTTVSFSSTADSYIGTISADVTNVNSGDYLKFTSAENMSTGFDVVSFFMKPKVAQSMTFSKWYINFYLDGVAVSSSIGVNVNLMDLTWQNISVRGNEFNFYDNEFDEIRLSWSQWLVSDYAGFYVDYVKIQGGFTQPPTAAGVNLHVNDTLRETSMSKLNLVEGDGIRVEYESGGKVTISSKDNSTQALTETSGAVAWNYENGSSATVTIDETTVITLTNVEEGDEGTIRITQGDAGDDNVTFILSGVTVEWRNDDTDLIDDSSGVSYVSFKRVGSYLGVTLGDNYVTQ